MIKQVNNMINSNGKHLNDEIHVYDGNSYIMNRLSKQKGGNPGGIFQHNGKYYYIKWTFDYHGDIHQKSLRAFNDMVGNRIYKISEIPVANSEMILIDNEKIGLKSRWLEGSYTPTIEEMKQEIQKGFLVDCLLSHWDVIGKKNKNIIKYESEFYRIDTGSTIFYRGLGKRRDESEDVYEIDNMRDESLDHSTLYIFKDLNINDMRKQLHMIYAIGDHTIDEIVNHEYDKLSSLLDHARKPDNGIVLDEAKNIKNILKKRRDNLIGKLEIS